MNNRTTMRGHTDANPLNPAGPSTAPSVYPLIEVRDLVKRYDDKIVLGGVNLAVERGETVVVIGGSGSGKTTLARLIVGLDRPTSGKIFLEGIELTSLSDHALSKVRRRFAMVFQSSALLDSLTVFDNVAFPLREETDFGEREIRRRVVRQLEVLEIEPAIDKLPSELSGGMEKRVAIARAMVMEPEILVYDEPTSGLDPITARVVDGLIDQMRQRFFVTSMVITHDMVTAFDVADRVVLLAHGKFTADGPPEMIFRSHRDDIRPFAVSSGVDIERLAPRKARIPPTEIRERWLAAHPAQHIHDRRLFHRWCRRES
jgi:phospholipid/cholesterol/gamma-HCH transport system ATP-binding protein